MDSSAARGGGETVTVVGSVEGDSELDMIDGRRE